MADYHYRYETHDKEDTEWEAIHRKLGNLPQKPKKKPPAPFEPKTDPEKNQDWLAEQQEDDLEDLEDDFDDDRFLEEYRKKRMEELKNKTTNLEFGALTQITGPQFIPHVTDASESVWVIVFMFQPQNAKCNQLESCIEELASDFSGTKFVKILSEDCIPGYPHQHLPTVLVYRNRSCKKTLTGLEPYGSSRVTPEAVAEVLNAIGPICKG